MFELVVLIVAILLFYGLAKKYMVVQNEKLAIWVADQKADLQDDLKALDDKIDNLKQANGGKWYTISSIESKMQ